MTPPRHIYLLEDALFALLNVHDQKHKDVVETLIRMDEAGVSPKYPYPVLLEMQQAFYKTKGPTQRARINTFIGEVADGSLLEVPILEDVRVACAILTFLSEQGLNVSPTVATVAAMAKRNHSVILTYDEQLRKSLVLLDISRAEGEGTFY